MAFVVKSPKISTFDQIANIKQPRSPQKINDFESESKAKRIHAATNIEGKLHHKNSFENLIVSEQEKSVSIPTNKLIFYYKDEQEEFRKFLLKKKYERMKQIVNHRKVKQIKKQREPDHKFYDVPSSFSHKKKQQKANLGQKENLYPWIKDNKEKNTREQRSPGPGFYEIQENYNICGPKFQNSVTCSLKPLLNQTSQKTNPKPEKLFPIKYEYMNSPFYRQASHNIKSSNSQLLTKLFCSRSGNSTANTQSELDSYEPVHESSPDPATYFQNLSKDKKSPPKDGRCFISGQLRFKNGSSSMNLQTSPASYFKEEQNFASTPSAAFCSGSLRFTMRQEDSRDIQNENKLDQLYKHSHNRSNIPFSSLLQRKNAEFFKEMQDQAGYYYNEVENRWGKDNFLALFSANETKRKVFESLNNFPGPGAYQQNQMRILKNKEMKKPSKALVKRLQQKDNKRLSQMKIGQRKSIQLSKNQILNAPRNCSPPQKLRKQYKKIEKVFQELNSKHEFSDVKGCWLKQSFNRNFAVDQILNANNPIQRKDYD